MKNKKHIYLFIPVILLFTISCTCGAPNLQHFLSNNESVTVIEQTESEIEAPESVVEAVEAPENEDTTLAFGAGITGGDIDVFNVNHFVNGDYVSVIGLIKNNTNSMINGVDLSMILYDADGKITATESVYPSLSMVPPGEIMPFYVSSDAWGNFARYEFVIDTYYETEKELVEGVVLKGHHINVEGYAPMIVGEIENNSLVPVEWVNIAGMVYDTNGILLDVATTYSTLDIIPPGGKSPFKMYMNYGWSGYDHYELIVQAEEAYEFPADIVVTDYETTSNDYSTTFTGTVKNNTSEDLSFVKVAATFYDEHGQVVSCDWTFAAEENIPANGTGTFELSIWEDLAYSEVVFQAQ